METKSIKIPTKVHRELKVFTAQHEDKMIEFAGFAIMKELAVRNHKFVERPKMNVIAPKQKIKLNNTGVS